MVIVKLTTERLELIGETAELVRAEIDERSELVHIFRAYVPKDWLRNLTKVKIHCLV